MKKWMVILFLIIVIIVAVFIGTSIFKLENNDNEYIIDYKYDDNDNITSKDYTLNNLNKDTYLIENIIYDYNSDDAITKVTFDNNKLNYKLENEN